LCRFREAKTGPKGPQSPGPGPARASEAAAPGSASRRFGQAQDALSPTREGPTHSGEEVQKQTGGSARDAPRPATTWPRDRCPCDTTRPSAVVFHVEHVQEDD
jgi:hypothetical protein